MRFNKFFLSICLAALSLLLLPSCDDQNFDWDAARNLGRESLYESLFTSIFGGIDENQSWDFSEGMTLQETRSEEATEAYEPVISADSAYYYVQQETLDWLKKELPESGTLYCTTDEEGKKHPIFDNSFIFYLPKTGFKLTPIYQGQGGMTWDVYMVVNNDIEHPVKIWSKSSELGTDISKTFFEVESTACHTCNGTGYQTRCTVCNGTGYVKCETCNGSGLVTSTCPTCHGNGKVKKKTCTIQNYGTGYYLDGTGISSSPYSYELVTYKGNNYLKTNNGKYLAFNNYWWPDFFIEVEDIKDAIPVDISESSNRTKIKFHASKEAYMYISRDWEGGSCGLYFTGGKEKDVYQVGGNDDWTYWTVEVTTTTIDTNCVECSSTGEVTNSCSSCDGTGHTDTKCSSCNGVGGTGTCQTCNGTGATFSDDDWVTVSSLGNNQQYPEDAKNTINAKAVRAKSLVWGTDTSSPLPAYKTAYLYLKITGYQDNEYVNYEEQFATKERMQTSINNQMIILTDCPRPSNVPANHDVAIIGCEDANLTDCDWDFNDIVFLMEGLPTLPLTSLSSTTEGTTKSFSINENVEKRYMVEDMGYAAAADTKESNNESSAAASNLTDIDFNDIVVDFSQTSKAVYSLTIQENGLGVNETITREDPVTTAKIRALGGTWDFSLLVGNNEVFRKSADLSTKKFNYSGKDHPVTINDKYPLFKSGTATKFDSRIIYNTGYTSTMRGDGQYETSDENGYLASFSVDGWDPDKNNVVFKLSDDTEDEDLISSKDSKNVYELSFPEVGACPKIIAFPTTKAWKRERVHVTKDWFK